MTSAQNGRRDVNNMPVSISFSMLLKISTDGRGRLAKFLPRFSSKPPMSPRFSSIFSFFPLSDTSTEENIN